MRRHAKASTAGSTKRQAIGFGRFFRGAGAGRGASHDAKGSGAPKARRLILPIGVLTAILAVFFVAMPAGAAIHQFEASFGAAGSGSGQFSSNKGIAVDQADGSIYVVDSGNFRVQKFNAAGNFVLMFGKGVDQTTPGDVCTAASLDTCKAGTQGSGGSGFDTNNGFSNPSFVAVDPTNGDVYVADSGTNVVDKFTSGGVFLSSNNGLGSGNNFAGIAGIAVDSSRNLWVYDQNAQMREFNSGGSFVAQWNSGYGVSAVGIAVDSTQHLYFVRGFPAVQKFSATGTDNGEIDGSGTATSVGIDPATDELYVGAGTQVNHFAANCVAPCSVMDSFGSGDIASAAGVALRGASGSAYVSDPGNSRVEVFKSVILPEPAAGSASGIAQTTATLNGTVNPHGVALTECKFEYGTTTGYGQSIPCAESNGTIGAGSSPVPVHADIAGLAPGITYHFRLVAANANGSANSSDNTFNTLSPPVIGEVWVQNVTSTEAIVKARINPKNFPTTYRVQWGTTASYGNETEPKAVGSDNVEHLTATFLVGLAPGTAYHYRVVATNSVATSEGPDQTFITYEAPVSNGNCPNQIFRAGSAALLPDCRAYEMVSPVDKNGGNILGLYPLNPYGRAAFEQAATSGEKITYSSGAAFADEIGAAHSNQYIGARGPDGWSVHGINPPRGLKVFPLIQTLWNIDSPFEAFSEDLSSAWLKDDNKYPITADAVENFGNLYRRDNMGDSFEALTVSPPVTYKSGEPGMGLEFRGASDSGGDQVFEALGSLTPDAAPTELRQIYDFSGGELHLVSVLPDGTAASGASVVSALDSPSYYFIGTKGENSRWDNAKTAVSADGSRIYWSSEATTVSPRILYLRENPAQPQSALNGSGECTEPAKACTLVVSNPAPPSESSVYFWAANRQGSEALFGEHIGGGGALEDLYTFDLATKTRSLVAHEVRGVLGASEDLDYFYFVSKEALAAGASAGQSNLYMDHEGALTFVAAFASADVPPLAEHISAVAIRPSFRDSRVTPDGRHVAFMSSSKALSEAVAGYDNTDAVNGEADMEVYLYEAGGDLICASCNPVGAAPVGEDLTAPYSPFEAEKTGVWAAAWLPTWEHELHASRALSDDGSRLFFNSFDPLLPQDSNGVQDVYEWEAQGSGDCHKEVGCISLISTGTSAMQSEFIDAGADGKDVFFRTSQSIDPRDPGLIDIYDARVDGGFPTPPEVPPCAGDACQPTSEAPRAATPASAGFRGAGNPAPHKARPRCRARARHAGKRGKKAKHKKAKSCRHNNRRAGR